MELNHPPNINLSKLDRKRHSERLTSRKSYTNEELNPVKFLKKLSENTYCYHKASKDSIASLDQKTTISTLEWGLGFSRTSRSSVSSFQGSFLENVQEDIFSSKYLTDPFFKIKIDAVFKEHETTLSLWGKGGQRKEGDLDEATLEAIKENDPAYFTTLKGKRVLLRKKLRDLYLIKCQLLEGKN